MDALGCLISAALLLVVFVVFGVVGRIIDGAIADIRYTIAPEVVSGVRAWEAARGRSAAPTAPSRPDDTGDCAGAAGGEFDIAIGPVRARMGAAGRQHASVAFA